MADTISKLAVAIIADTIGLRNGLDVAASLLGAFDNQVDKTGKNIKSLSMSGVIEMIGLQAISFGLKEMIKLAAEAERTEVAFSTMLRDANKAKALIAEIREFAVQTPFTSRELVAASQQLLAYGFAAEQIIPTMRALGDVSSALNIPLGDLAYLFGTLKTQGRAFARDINQFTNRGVPMVDELAKVMGVAKNEVMGLVEEGKVGFPEVLRALERMTSGPTNFFKGKKINFDQMLAESFRTPEDANNVSKVFERLQQETKGDKIKFGDVLADQMHVGKEALNDMVASGQIGMEDLRKAFDKLTTETGIFYGMTENISKTLSGKWSTFVDYVQLLAIDFGTLIVEALSLKDALAFAVEITNALRKAFAFVYNVFRPVIELAKLFFDIFVVPIKAAVAFVQVLFTMLAEAFGSVGYSMHDASMNVTDFVKDMRKLIPSFQDLKRYSFDFIEAIAIGFAHVAEVIDYIADVIIGRMVQGFSIVIREILKGLKLLVSVLAELPGSETLLGLETAAEAMKNAVESMDRTAKEFGAKANAFQWGQSVDETRKKMGNLREAMFGVANVAEQIKKNLEAPVELPKDLIEGAKKLKEEFANPIDKFFKEERRLFDMLSNNLIDEDLYSRAVQKAFADVEKEANFNSKIELPKAMELNSADAISAINRFNMGTTQDDVQKRVLQVMEAINDKAQGQLDAARDLIEAFRNMNPAKPARLP